MSAQPTTPTSTSMLHIIVPTFVPLFGPQFSRLPDELILEIFKQIATTMFPPGSRFNEIITPTTFAILNRHYAINRIRGVSRGFATFFMQAFYENFTFSFKHRQIYNFWSQYLTSLPAPLPAHPIRQHLRSLRIEIVLENYFFSAQEIFVLPASSALHRTRRKITTARQLLVFCPAARQLHDLCDPILGFGNLTFLGLHIRTDFRHYAVDDEFLRAIESANFVITASKVELVVTDNAGFVTAEQEEVKKRIVAK